MDGVTAPLTGLRTRRWYITSRSRAAWPQGLAPPAMAQPAAPAFTFSRHACSSGSV